MTAPPGTALSWARQLSAGAPPALVAQIVRLASAPWMRPERLRDAVADLLDAGRAPDAGDVVAALEGCASGRRGALPTWLSAEEAARELLAAGARVHVIGAPGYPRQLSQAWPELGAPLWLFVHAPEGRLPAGPAVAVVGTRKPTLDGLKTARALGRYLARNRITVVSGMARGIDQAAHLGALDEGGRTVAVLGAGFGVDYPRGSSRLRDEISAAGGLVTELRPGCPPQPQHFLWRNRLIAGLADATVLVEGRARSGAAHTARLADAQGRHVLAAPGSLNQATAQAPLELIRDGASPLTHFGRVLELLGLAGSPDAPPDAARAIADPVANAVLALLSATPASPGELAAASGEPLPAVLAALAELTDRGLARATPRGVVGGG